MVPTALTTLEVAMTLNFVSDSKRGFTLIELAMVILLVGILSAVAIPMFIDFRTDAKNAATKGSLGALRSAVVVARAAIALREAASTPDYPTAAEFQTNKYAAGSHPVLGAANERLMDLSTGIPDNPWTLNTVPAAQWSSVWDCSTLAKGTLLSVGAVAVHTGWCYDQDVGQFWANSAQNTGGAGETENNY